MSTTTRARAYDGTPIAAVTGAGWVALATEAERLSVRRGDIVAVRRGDGAVRAYTAGHEPWQDERGAWVLRLAGVHAPCPLNDVVAKRGADQ